MQQRLAAILIPLGLFIGPIGPVNADNLSVTFTRIADTNTGIPGGTGNFTSFEAYSIDPSGVAFVAYGAPAPSTQVGVYTYAGGVLSRIADRSMVAPGGSQTFADLEEVSIDNGKVAIGAFAPNSGVWTNVRGPLERAASAGQPIPGGTGNFTSVESVPILEGGRIIFGGSGAGGQTGLYAWENGVRTLLVNQATSIPGAAATFRYINADTIASRNGQSAVFYAIGTDEVYGLHRLLAGALSTIADNRGQLPDGRGSLLVGSAFGGPAVDGDDIAFVAFGDPGGDKLVADFSGQLTVLVAPGTTSSGTTWPLLHIRNPWIEDRRVVFWGVGANANNRGLFHWNENGLTKIIALGDPLDGSAVSSIFTFGNEGFSNGSAVFLAGLADGRSGIYAAELTIDVVEDTDGDGIQDDLDNCTTEPDPGQCDSDGDGFGNRCDGDLNNNGSTNAQDSVLYRAQLGQPSVAPVYNPADINCSGAVNAQDTTLFRSLLGVPPGPSGTAP